MNKVNIASINTGNENLDKLRRVFPQFVKENKIDFDVLKIFFEDEEIITGEEKYGLNWTGKSNAFKLIRTPSVGTLTPQEKESKNWDKTENIFIEGDSLEVLKLLQKHYREKIKMIYIDPPYNTGKDFIYKDNYTENISDYYEKTGQSKNGIKMTTNPESNGRYHSDWLTMIYPRLFLAKNLLRDDGIIFVSIDDIELINLRIILNEIFGEENFVATFIWKSRQNKDNRNITGVSIDHEYIVCYSRNYENKTIKGNERKLEQYSNPDSDPRGNWASGNMVGILPENLRPNCHYDLINPKTGINYGKPKMGWRYEKTTMTKLIAENRIIWPTSSGGRPRKKVFLKELKDPFTNLSSIIRENIYTRHGTKEIEELFGFRAFDFPKPSILIKELINQVTQDQDIILDFFAGSGTTAHAVMDINAENGEKRKWIMVQLPEAINEESQAYKAGYKNIVEIARERIRRAGKKISKGDIDFKSLSLTKSNYRQWNILTDKDDKDKLKKQMKLFLEKPLVDGYDEKSVVYEILLKEGYNLNSKVTQGKTGNIKYWQVIDRVKKLVMTFEKKVTKDQFEFLKLSEEDTFVCLDSALDDTTKINIGRNFNVKVI